MKKLFLILFGGLTLALASCGGGWTDEQLTTLKNDCVMKGGYDCDCYVKKAQKIFKNPDEYNKKDSKKYEKFQEAIQKCAVEEENTAADSTTTIESF